MTTIVHWKLSPNEEAERIRKEKEDRRKTRLLQVRQQQRVFAKKLRNDIKKKREEERRLLLNHLNAQYEAFCEEELDRLQEKCQRQLQMIGSGHLHAKTQATNDEESSRMRKLTANRQKLESAQRYREAMEELSNSQALEAQCHNKPLVDRKKALDIEKDRARRIADLPAPQSYDIVMDLHSQKGKRVTLQGVEGYASSYYHIPSSSDIVQRASHDQEQLNACQSAMKETCRRNTLEEVNTRQETEQCEKARLRHKHALARVKLEKDQETLVKELEQLMRQDRVQRRHQLSTMPPNLFQPMQRRCEIRNEQQRDMEQAFEDLFVRCQGSGKGLDGLGKEIPLPGTSPNAPAADDDDESVHSTSECPELSVEEMTTTLTTDTSSVQPHPPSTADASSNQSKSLEITTASSSMNITGASNSSSGSLKRLMEMVEQQRQAWQQQQQQQQQGGQDDTVVSSRHHSSKDTTISSCDPASLSIATASGSWDTSDNSANKNIVTDDSSLQPAPTTRSTAPIHIPTVESSMTSSDTSHEPTSQSPCYNSPTNHVISPTHHVHVISPTHHVHASSPTHSVSSSGSSSSDSQCSTPTQSHTQHLVQTDDASTSEDESSSSGNEEFTVMGQTERPFSWENLSEVEDKESAVPAMVEPEELQLSPYQFSALVSEVSTSQPSSLQEAFRQRKAGFISNSQSRVREVKERNQQRMATTSTNHHQHRTPTHAPKASSARVVQFSSPLITLQDTGVFTPPTIHRVNTERFARLLSSQEKITAKQMKERTKRLYDALPEVQQRKEAELRQQRNATNRERARQFHHKLQQHRKKQRK